MPLTVLSLPDFIVAWEPTQTAYVLGESPALQFSITRQDNGLVPVPTAGTLILSYPDGTNQTASATFISSGVAAPAINIGADTLVLSQSGAYRVAITGITFTGSDVQARSQWQIISVNLPYDGGLSVLGLTRFYCADVNLTDPDFLDGELVSLLSVVGQIAEMAAARALRALAADYARLAVVTKKGTRGNDETGIYTALMETAAALEKSVVSVSQICPPPRMCGWDDYDRSQSFAPWDDRGLNELHGGDR